ncbi:unnamed protein product [Sphagnum tenellum]
MDPVGLLYLADKRIAAIIFPIAETLKQVRSLASSDEKMTLLLVNPQWRLAVTAGGGSMAGRHAEEFVDTLKSHTDEVWCGDVHCEMFPRGLATMLYQKRQSFRHSHLCI